MKASLFFGEVEIRECINIGGGIKHPRKFYPRVITWWI